ncbi:MAG: EamA family transporter [Sphingobacteriaceae bacterium]|nr:EamA family transporter [Sphingobacteriaceae bacterium]
MFVRANLKLIVALLVVAIVWGTTYLAIRMAVETIPPWYVTGMRQTIAALVLLVYLLFKNQLQWIGWQNFKRNFLLSMLMIVIANGFTTYAEKSIPSGLTALLTSLSPLIIFLGGVMVKVQKPSLKGFLGVLIGFSGVAFIFRHGLQDLFNPSYKTGIMFLSIAILGWSTGTIYTKKHAHKPSNIFLNLFYQFSFAAIVQLFLAVIFSDGAKVSDWSTKSFLSVVYMAVFGSVITYYFYSYALKHVSAAKVSILNYFNTIIALFLGWLVLDEKITFDFIIATALIILGVFITNYKPNKNEPLAEN